ncbi:hypothetical protein ACVMIX_006612 [Rhizobium leguminosarum]
MEEIYESESEALDAITARLEIFTDLDKASLRAFVRSVEPFEEKPISSSRKPGGAQRALVGNIAIRDDQIRLLESFLLLMKNGAKIVLAVPQLATTAGFATFVDGVHGLFTLYCALISRGFKLSPEELLIVSAMREIQVGTTEDVRERLGKQLDGADLDEVLAKFSIVKEPDRGFIASDAAGRWQVKGL